MRKLEVGDTVFGCFREMDGNDYRSATEQKYKPSVNKTDIVFPCTVIGKKTDIANIFVGTDDIALGLWPTGGASYERYDYPLLHPGVHSFAYGYYVRGAGDMRIVKVVRAKNKIVPYRHRR